jgi:hypothetical protein
MVLSSKMITNGGNVEAKLALSKILEGSVLDGNLLENSDNYCDVCGVNTRVIAFYCAGDEATHMYCRPCAECVIVALKAFVRYG